MMRTKLPSSWRILTPFDAPALTGSGDVVSGVPAPGGAEVDDVALPLERRTMLLAALMSR